MGHIIMSKSESVDCQPPREPVRGSAALEYLVPLLLYSFLAAASAYLRRGQLNPDGTNYIRFATYIAEGRPWMAVSGYWSPLLVFCVAPFRALGIDGQIAARTVLALWGAVLVAGSTLLSRRCLNVPRLVRILLACAVAANAAFWTSNVITPDLLLSACLLFYFPLACSPEILSKTRLQCLAGAVGGLAYLAKSFGLPFVLAHYTLAVAFHCMVSKSSKIQALRAWMVGVAAFFVIAGPWIAVISYKYETLTVSRVGAAAFAIVGPDYVDQPNSPKKYEPHSAALRLPAEGRLFLSEDLDMQPYHSWSPLESKDNFLFFVRKIIHTSANIVDYMRSFDFFGCILLLAVCLPPLLLAVGQFDTRQAICYLGTIAMYCGGFLPVWCESRYMHGFVWVLLAAFSTQALCDVWKLLASHPRAADLRIRPLMLGTLAAVLLASAVYYPLSKTWSAGQLKLGPTPVHQVALELQSAGFAGPVAGCKHSYSRMAFLFAYYLNVPIYGETHAATVEDVERDLDKWNVKIFVAMSDWTLYSDFTKGTHWVRKATKLIPPDPSMAKAGLWADIYVVPSSVHPLAPK